MDKWIEDIKQNWKAGDFNLNNIDYLIKYIQSLEALIAKKDEAIKKHIKAMDDLMKAPPSYSRGQDIAHLIGKLEQALTLTVEDMGERMEKMERVVEAAASVIAEWTGSLERAFFEKEMNDLEQALAKLDK